MADHLAPGQRSALMSRVKSRDTVPEKIIRSFVHRQGYRFRLCVRELPGSPDIVFPRHKKIILVHGCFWHQHKGCLRAKRPTSSVEFWNIKLDRNVSRDGIVLKRLRQSGWRCLVVWECDVKKNQRKVETKVLRFLKNGRPSVTR